MHLLIQLDVHKRAYPSVSDGIKSSLIPSLVTLVSHFKDSPLFFQVRIEAIQQHSTE